MYYNNLFVTHAVNHWIDAAVDEHKNNREAMEAAVDVGVGLDSAIEQEVVHLVRSPADNV
jgi:hypothetical protein